MDSFNIPFISYSRIDTLAPLEQKNACDMVPCQQGNNPMYNDTKVLAVSPIASAVVSAPVDPVVDQRKYLKSRVDDVYFDLKRSLRKQFFIDEPRGPKTIGELQAALKDGKYTIRDADKPEKKFYYPWDYFSWRTADTQADEAGYEAAKAQLSTLYKTTMDTITVSDPKDGLVALQTFEAFKAS